MAEKGRKGKRQISWSKESWFLTNNIAQVKCFHCLNHFIWFFSLSLLSCVLNTPVASPVAQLVKNLPAMQKTPVQFLGWEDPLEKGQAPVFLGFPGGCFQMNWKEYCVQRRQRWAIAYDWRGTKDALFKCTSVPKKGNSKECSNYCTIVLISHPSKVMLKILQVRLQQYMNHELPDVQAGFTKGRGTRDQIVNIQWFIKKTREFQKNIYFCFID